MKPDIRKNLKHAAFRFIVPANSQINEIIDLPSNAREIVRVFTNGNSSNILNVVVDNDLVIQRVPTSNLSVGTYTPEFDYINTLNKVVTGQSQVSVICENVSGIDFTLDVLFSYLEYNTGAPLCRLLGTNVDVVIGIAQGKIRFPANASKVFWVNRAGTSSSQNRFLSLAFDNDVLVENVNLNQMGQPATWLNRKVTQASSINYLYNSDAADSNEHLIVYYCE